MRFALTDEQSALRDSVRGSIKRQAPPTVVREWLESGDSGRASELCVAQGWTGIGVPLERDGQGGGLVELAIVIEELAGAALPGAMLCHTGLALPLAMAASEPEAVISQLIAGERLASVLIDAGEIVQPPPSKVTSDGDGGWLITGGAQHVLVAAEVDLLLILVSASDSEGGLFAVDLSASGVSIDELPAADMSRRLVSVALENTPAVRLGDLGDGSVNDLANRAAVVVAADALGTAAKMLELTVAYVRDREQFGVPVGSFQAVKHECAEMLVDVESSRSAAYFAAWSVENGDANATSHASVAKFVCTEAASRVADHAMSLHGAVGFTWEHDLHFLFKRAKADLALFGSPTSHRERVAGLLLDDAKVS